MTVEAIVQARRGSRRLPGKVLMDLGGSSLLRRVIDRLTGIEKISRVIVATTDLEEDDAVEKEALRCGADVFRGSRDDVLGRFLDALKVFPADYVLRVTADNPLTDRRGAERLAGLSLEGGFDYIVEKGLPVGAGVEAVSRKALEESSVTSEPSHREHVTLFIKENTSRFRVLLLDPPPELMRPEVRLTVDNRDDMEFVRAMVETLGPTRKDFSLEEVLKIHDQIRCQACTLAL